MPSNRRAIAASLPMLALTVAVAFAPAVSPAAARGMTLDDVARLRSVTSAEISPDGTHVAYVVSVPRDPYADDDGAPWAELHVATAAGASRPYVAGEVNVSAIAWTPDGREITYLAQRHGDEHAAVWAIPVDGGESRRIAGFDTDIAQYALAPAGDRIAFLARDKKAEVHETREKKGFTARVVEEGLEPVRVRVAGMKRDGAVVAADVTTLAVEGSFSALRWSPDGTRLALAGAPTPRIDDEYMETRVRIVDLEGNVLAKVDNPGKLGDFRWSPDGTRLALISAADLNDPNAGRLVLVPASGGVPVDLLPDLAADVERIAWKDASTIVVVVDRGTESALREVRIDGVVGAAGLDFGGPIWDSLSLSADGSRAAMVAETPTHPGELYVHGAGAAAAERWTDTNPWLAEIDFAVQETIVWKARDGLEIEGVLIRPLGEAADTRYPLIHVVHGGPESHYSNGWLTRYSNPGQVAAAAGYAVLHANYRGSTGRGVAFSKLDQADYAGDPSGEKAGEFWDLVDGIDHLVASGLVDRKKVGVTGGSYGGFASAWCATALTEHFAASVMFVGISDHVSKFGTTDIPNEMYLVHARRWPWDHWDWFRERSPIYHTPKARTPILILHGENDTRVPPSQSMELYRYLKTLGNVPVRLVLYPGEGHGNRKAASRYDYGLRLMRWMDHYLKGPGGAPPPYELELDAARLGTTPAAD